MILLFITLTFFAVFAGLLFFARSKRQLPFQLYIFAAIVIIGLFYNIYIELLSGSMNYRPMKSSTTSYVWVENDKAYISEVVEFESFLMSRVDLQVLVSRVTFFSLFAFGGFMMYAVFVYNSNKDSKLRRQQLWQIAKFVFSLKE